MGETPPFPALSKDGPRVARVRCLSAEEKERVKGLSNYTEMPASERKRQFAALDRRMKDVDTLPPGLLQQYQASFGNSEKKFELLNLRCDRLAASVNGACRVTWPFIRVSTGVFNDLEP